jgi:hypothetical protein
LVTGLGRYNNAWLIHKPVFNFPCGIPVEKDHVQISLAQVQGCCSNVKMSP